MTEHRISRPPHANGSETQDETGARLGWERGGREAVERLPPTALPTNRKATT